MYLCSVMTEKRHFYALLLVLCLTTLPWLGRTHFYTKGEPREAVVAQTMLAQNNWVLPHNNGGEMAYKPPFFHWTIAVTSVLTGGRVTEWTARFPSALAAICLMMWMYVFYARRRDSATALLATLVCFTCFEVFRAAYACRVDMMLALFTTGAMFAFARWTECERRGIPWLAILMMSLGALTKGPVAILLPCGVTGLYMLVRRERLLPPVGWMVLSGAMSLVLPALWYYAAWQQGGDDFLALVREENVDRFLGKMTYRSHENGLWYYFVLLPAGLRPWIVPAVWVWWRNRYQATWPIRWRELSPETLYSALAFLVIFVFYCIPKSKRGVYLLPLYPFAAWFLAIALRSWSERVRRVVFSLAAVVWVVTFALVLPLIVNKKSDIDTASDIRRMNLNGPLLSHFQNNTPGNPMHFFTINFYLNDGVGTWTGQEKEGYILLNEREKEAFLESQKDYTFQLLYMSSHKSCDTHQRVCLYQFSPVRSCSK